MKLKRNFKLNEDNFSLVFNSGNWFIKSNLKIYYHRTIDELAMAAILDGDLSRTFLIYKDNKTDSGILLQNFNDDNKINEIINKFKPPYRYRVGYRVPFHGSDFLKGKLADDGVDTENVLLYLKSN